MVFALWKMLQKIAFDLARQLHEICGRITPNQLAFLWMVKKTIDNCCSGRNNLKRASLHKKLGICDQLLLTCLRFGPGSWQPIGASLFSSFFSKRVSYVRNSVLFCSPFFFSLHNPPTALFFIRTMSESKSAAEVLCVTKSGVSVALSVPSGSDVDRYDGPTLRHALVESIICAISEKLWKFHHIIKAADDKSPSDSPITPYNFKMPIYGTGKPHDPNLAVSTLFGQLILASCCGSSYKDEKFLKGMLACVKKYPVPDIRDYLREEAAKQTRTFWLPTSGTETKTRENPLIADAQFFVERCSFQIVSTTATIVDCLFDHPEKSKLVWRDAAANLMKLASQVKRNFLKHFPKCKEHLVLPEDLMTGDPNAIEVQFLVQKLTTSYFGHELVVADLVNTLATFNVAAYLVFAAQTGLYKL